MMVAGNRVVGRTRVRGGFGTGSFWGQVLVVCVLVAVGSEAVAQRPGRRGPGREGRTSQSLESATTASMASTDFFSDEEWRRLPREQRRRRFTAQMRLRYEPSGQPTVERIPSYVEKFRNINVYDERLFRCEVAAEHVAGTTGSVVVKGEVSLGRFRTGVEKVLTDLGFNVVRNEIAVLPAAVLGKEIYGVVTTISATMRREPRPRAEQVNSVSWGGPIRLLREARESDLPTARDAEKVGFKQDVENGQKWYLAQSAEGYLGFMRDREFRRCAEWTLPDAILTSPTVVQAGNSTVRVPAGCWLKARGQGKDAGFLLGGEVEIPAGTPVTDLRPGSITAESILELTGPFMGTPYVWGGVTDDGIDCSGFTQFFCRSRGVFLPRDAEEQAVVGQLVAWGENVEKAAMPGDLVFFGNDNGKVSHVGISLGNGKIIHSADRDGVHIMALRDKRDADSPAMISRVLFARRPVVR